MAKIIGRSIVTGAIGFSFYVGAFLASDLKFSIGHLIGWIVLAITTGNATYALTALASEAWFKGKED